MTARCRFDHFDLFRCAQAHGRGAAIGADEAAAAEQDAAEPARDDDGDPIERLAVDRLQDRLSRRAARLAVVAEAIVLADPEGPAIVAGGRIGMRAR